MIRTTPAHGLKIMVLQSKLLKLLRMLPLFFFLFFFVAINNAAEIALSPSSFYYDNLLRNTTFDDRVIIFNQNDYPFAIQAHSLHGFAQTDSVDSNNNIVAPHSKKEILFHIMLNESLANGIYEDYLLFDLVQNNKSKQQMNINAGIGVKITLVVQDQENKNYTLKNMLIQDSEVGLPLQAMINLENNGNVAIAVASNLLIIDSHNTTVFEDEREIPLQLHEDKKEVTYYNISDLEEGDYTAILRTTVADRSELESYKEINFVLHPLGTFSRKGVLENFSIDNEQFIVGKAKKITGVFVNQGNHVANAKLIVEVTQNDVFVQNLESEELLIEPGEEKNFSVSFTPLEIGNYRLVGKILFNKKESETKEITLTVHDTNEFHFFTGAFIGNSIIQNNTALLEMIVLFCIIVGIACSLAKKE